MFNLDLLNILFIAAFVINLFLGILIFFRNRAKRVNQIFGLMVFSIALWIIFIFIYLNQIDPVKIVLWANINFLVASTFPSFLLYFSYIFPVPNSWPIKKSKLLIFIPMLIVWFFALTSKITISAITPSDYEYGYGYYIFFLYFVLYIGFSFLKLVHSHRTTKGSAKEQVKFVLLGLLIFAVLAASISLILPLLGIKNLLIFGPLNSIVFVCFVAYAITRYRLMDIRLVVIRSIAFGSIVLLITGIFAALSASLGRFLEVFIGTKSDLLVGLIVAFLIAIAYSPIKKIIERATNAFLFKKTYNPDNVITEITEVSTSILDLKNMMASMSQTLEDAMHPNGIGFNLLDKQGKLQVTYEHGFGKTIYDLTKGKEKVLPMYFKDSKQIYVIEELKTAYEQGEYKPKNVKLMYALYEADIALIVPLFTKEKLIGIIAIGNKKSGDLYTKQDLHVLNIISGQAAVGIENALLYEEQKLFGIKLEKTVKERTAELRVANVQLTKLDEAKSEFISIASHQLRTPLTIIKGYISMILEGSFGKTSKVIHENLNKVYSSNERLIGLVEDLLNISRIESGRQEYNFQPINLIDLGQTVFDELVQKAKDKGLKFNFTKPPKALPKVVADSDKLHEVMINFTDNSVKYTPKGRVDMSIYQKDDNLIFAVKDTGIGMNEDDKGHLFKKFSRAEGTFLIHTEGTGLGLYVAKMIAESHMGKVWAESEGRGKGSTFYFSIPIQGKGQKVGVTKQERIKSLDVRAEANKSEMPEKR